VSWRLYDILLRSAEPLCDVDTLDDAARKAAEIFKVRNTKLKAINISEPRVWGPDGGNVVVYFDGTGD
jgi:hypothetical protein